MSTLRLVVGTTLYLVAWGLATTIYLLDLEWVNASGLAPTLGPLYVLGTIGLMVALVASFIEWETTSC